MYAFQPTGSAWIPTTLHLSKKIDIKKFQPTGSVWIPTFRAVDTYGAKDISTHGIRVDPDDPYQISDQYTLDFNPRDPCGSRRLALTFSNPSSLPFQPTGSV